MNVPANVPAQAWKDLRFLATSLRGLLALEEQLTEAGSIEKLIAASRERLRQAQADEAAFLAKLEEREAAAAALEAAAEKTRADAAAEAEATIARAKRNAEEAAAVIIRKARDDADGIVADARRKADEVERMKSTLRDALA